MYICINIYIYSSICYITYQNLLQLVCFAGRTVAALPKSCQNLAELNSLMENWIYCKDSTILCTLCYVHHHVLRVLLK